MAYIYSMWYINGSLTKTTLYFFQSYSSLARKRLTYTTYTSKLCCKLLVLIKHWHNYRREPTNFSKWNEKKFRASKGFEVMHDFYEATLLSQVIFVGFVSLVRSFLTGPTLVSWLLCTLAPDQCPFSATLEILGVVMGDGRWSWRLTATRYCAFFSSLIVLNPQNQI